MMSDKGRHIQVEPHVSWKDAGSNNMIFRSDMAYELGGGRSFNKSVLTITEREDLVPEDEILLAGPDLQEIHGDCDFSRISIVRVDGEAMGEGDKLYNAIRSIEFTKYHVNPEGYMLRISSGNQTESVRVGKQALENGLSFSIVGSLYLKQFHEDPRVKAVKEIFITDPDLDYAILKQKIEQAQAITKAIDHILKDTSIMDCKACNLQQICDEVEGLREMHFQNGNGKV